MGGMRVIVTRDRLRVKLGVLGIPLVCLDTSDIDEAEVFSFSPLRDFGGYGIRINRRMKGYFFRGNRGVRVVAKGQKKPMVIGSDNPERLAAVIRAATMT